MWKRKFKLVTYHIQAQREIQKANDDAITVAANKQLMGHWQFGMLSTVRIITFEDTLELY